MKICNKPNKDFFNFYPVNRRQLYIQKKIMDKQQNNINIDIDEDDRKWVIRDYLDSDNEEGFIIFILTQN